MEHPDRSLRHMVARLSTMSPADVEAIMGSLSDEQKARVIDLLVEPQSDYAGRCTQDSQVDESPLIVPDNLSCWLKARISGNPAAGDEVVERFSITEHSVAALRACAREMVRQPRQLPVRPSLIERAWQYLVAGRPTRWAP